MQTKENSSSPGSLTEEQILRLAQQATELWKNPVFSMVVEMMLAETIQKIDAAAPEHTKEVMWAKQERQVIGSILQRIPAFIHRAEKVYMDMQERNSPEAKEQRRLDEQGFFTSSPGGVQ